MFCSKCGKTIEDNAVFCPFCGASANNAANTVTNGAPQAPQYGAPQAPQYGAPQAPQAPQYGAPNSSGSVLNISPNIINWIKLGLSGVIGILSLLVLIASICTLATTGSVFSGNYLNAFKLPGVVTFARVPAIMCFSFSVLGVVFAVLTKQQWKLIYICAGISVVMFVFNFVIASWLSSASPAPLIVGGIFLLACSSSMLSIITRTVLKDFIKKIK